MEHSAGIPLSWPSPLTYSSMPLLVRVVTAAVLVWPHSGDLCQHLPLVPHSSERQAEGVHSLYRVRIWHCKASGLLRATWTEWQLWKEFPVFPLHWAPLSHMGISRTFQPSQASKMREVPLAAHAGKPFSPCTPLGSRALGLRKPKPTLSYS